MDAIKCDRCGCYCDKITYDLAVTEYNHGRGFLHDGRKDLCIECQKSLEKWWKS